VIAAYEYPFVEPGRRYVYCGRAFALGAKMMEGMSGEAFPLLLRRHLLAPLTMRDTDALDSHRDGISTAWDQAKLGQMLLNRGRYGRMEFFRPESMNAMLPPTNRSDRGGIGLEPMWRAILGPTAFGHTSASSGVLIVLPDRDLVFVVTSTGAQKTFSAGYPELFRVLLEQIAPSSAASIMPASTRPTSPTAAAK
jgi:CubicO group peptidase (beta-lactamase class C family)